MTGPVSTPWADLVQAALKLGLKPAEFWQLSLREWNAITREKKRSGFRRSDLSRLISAFPDKE